MAKKRGRKGGTVTSYFRDIFTERPDWLQQKSNNDVLARYRADHQMSPEAEVDPKIKNTMANLKSMMRKDVRAGVGGVVAVVVARVPSGTAQRLERLEEQIDDCLSLAKRLDPEGLRPIIRSLCAARNELVWKMGQP